MKKNSLCFYGRECHTVHDETSLCTRLVWEIQSNLDINEKNSANMEEWVTWRLLVTLI